MASKNLTMSPEMVNHLITWIDEVNSIMAAVGTENICRMVEWEDGRKYVRVWARYTKGGDGRSCYAFIDKATGEVFRPASWKAPAKHARGNIAVRNTSEYCGPYGVAYLR